MRYQGRSSSLLVSTALGGAARVVPFPVEDHSGRAGQGALRHHRWVRCGPVALPEGLAVCRYGKPAVAKPVSGQILIRVSRELIPDQALEYERALADID
jgi:hypothetical protein